MGQQLQDPLCNKLATQSAKRLIGPRGRSKGWLWWAWTRTSDPFRSPALLGPFLIGEGLRQLEAHRNRRSCCKLPFYASADRGWPSDLWWPQHQARLLSGGWMRLLLLLSLLITTGTPFLPSPPLGFSSESLPHLAKHLSPVPSCLPPNLLVRPGLSVLVTLTSQLLGCGEKGPALSFQIWELMRELPIMLVSGDMDAPRGIFVAPAPSHRALFPKWQSLQCRQNPRSCCLPNAWACSQDFCGRIFFPWGSATAGARGVNPINICQVSAWCPAALEGTLRLQGRWGWGVGMGRMDSQKSSGLKSLS